MSSMSHRAYLSLGSNIGDREKQLKDALEILQADGTVRVSAVSSLYETDPVGYENQDMFLNIAVEVETGLEPLKLLAQCQKVEQELKRERIIRWGPRTMDVDILLYDDIRMNETALIIPHPRMNERAFVLVPLSELAPDLILDGESITTRIEKLEGGKVRKISWLT